MNKSFSGLMLLGILPSLLNAFPQSPEVVFGEISISQTDSNTMMIVASDRAIINYREFDVGPIERVEFIQPSSASTVLNRVTGPNPSQILGDIRSNGKVFLVNPHGVYFGRDSTVDTGSLIVSTLDILDQDFLEDRFFFHSKEGTPSSLIHNEGTLSASDVVLIAPKIKNEGTIYATLNKVLLASSEVVTLTFSGDGLMSFEIEDSVKEGFIEHLGNIEANEVFIQLSSAKETIQNVINTEGLLDGNAIIQKNGKVRISHQSSIKASNAYIEGTKVSVEGQIDISNKVSEKKGGTLHVLGDHLELVGAYIDASGDNGGGTVLIGGEYKGQGNLRKALTSYMDETSCIKADALSQGDGGRVILWADDTTVFNGTIFAKGGSLSGNGGFVETSGKETLSVGTGHVNTLAPFGKAGDWLLDPTTITIDSSGAGTLVQAADCTNVSTGVTIAPATINAAASNVILCASTSITQNAAQTISITTSGVGITFQGTGGVISTTLNANITTISGAITFTNTTVTFLPALALTTNGSASSGADISFDNTLNSVLGGHSLTFNAGSGNVIFGSSVGSPNGFLNLNFNSVSQIRVGGSITVIGGTTTTFPSPVVLTGNCTFTSSNSAAIFSSTINGAQSLSFSIGTGSVTFSGAVGGTTPLTNLTFTTATAVNVGANITVSGANPLTFAKPVQLTGTSSITSNNANISFSSTLNGAQALTLIAGTGTVTFSGTVGGITPPTNITFTSSSAINVGANITVSGANTLTFAQAVQMTGTSTITSNNANIGFSSTLNGAQALTIAGGSGTTTFTGAVGATTALTSLSVTSATIAQSSTAKTTGALSYTGSTAINVNGNITTSGGIITMTGPSILTGALTFDSTNAGGTAAGANINFSGSTTTVNFSTANTLTLRAGTGGSISFGGAVGGTTPPTNITFTSSSAINVGANITVSGANPLTFAQAVRLTGTSTITSNNANIGFSSTLNGAQALTIAGGSGTTTFTGAVGATTALTSLSVTSATITQSSTAKTTGALSYTGSTAININGSITTSSGIVTMAGPTTLLAGLTFDSTNGGASSGADVSFNNTLNSVVGGHSIIFRVGSGNVIFGSSVGSPNGFLNITFTSASQIRVGGSITVIGGTTTTFPFPVVLTGNCTFTSSNSAVIFSSTIDGAQALSFSIGTGSVTFSGAVGGTTPLTNLIFTNASAVNVGANITVSGANPLTFAKPVQLTGTSTITSNNANIGFSSTLNGAQALTIAGGSGTTTFTGAVGATTALTSLSATSATITQSSTAKTTGALSYTGSTAINIQGNVTTSGGTISMIGPVLLTNNPIFDSTNGGGSATGANISFSSTLDGADATESLTMLAGTLGDVSFAGNVGGITPFTDLSITAALIQIGANVTVTGANPLIFSSPVSMTGVSVITSNNANITFGSKLDGGGSLTLTAGTGTITFTLAVGSITPLASLIATGSTITQDSSLQSVGAVTYTASPLSIGGSIITSGGIITMTGPVVLTNTATFDSTNSGGSAAGADINFSTTLNGAESLTLAAGIAGIITFTNAVGAVTPLTNLSFTNAALIQIGGNVTVTGANPLTFTDPVSLIGTSTITSNNANLTFSSTLDGSHPLTLLGGTGTVTFAGTVGGSLELPSLTVTSSAIVQSSSLSSAGTVTYTNTGLLTIGGTLSAGSLHQSGGGTVLLEASIVVTSSIFFTNSITFNDSLSFTAAGVGGITLQSPMIPTADGIYDLTLSALSGTITAPQLGSPSEYINVLTLTSASFNITSIYANTVIKNGSSEINSDITAPGAALRFNSPTTVAAGTFTIDVSGGSSPGSITFASTLDGSGSLIFTLGEGSLIFTDNVGGIVSFGDASITSAQNVTVSKDFTGSSFTQLAGGGTTTILGTMSTSTSTGVSLTGTIFDIVGPIITTGSGPVVFDNTGLLILANTINSNGVVSQTGSGAISFGSAITTTNAVAVDSNVSFTGAITLTSDASINTSIGGGNITFGALATINGLYDLTFIAGSGDISLSGEIGGLTPLNVLTIYSVNDLTLPLTTVSALKQAAGTGTTTIGGALTTTGNSGVEIACNILTINATVQTIGRGSIILQNSGVLTLSSGAQITAAGSLIRKGSTATNLSGNITTR